MRFTPNEDQALFLAALEQMAGDPAAAWRTSPLWARFDWSETFDSLLAQSGFFDAAREESLGRIAAAAMVQRLAELPVTVECAASTLLRTALPVELPRPIAVIEGVEQQAVRLLPVARSVVHLGGAEVRFALIGEGVVQPVESIFAYPMGRLVPGAVHWQDVECDAQAIRDLWRIGIACEMTGALKGGLDAVLAHVRERHQFGRPLGSFQAVQHRLAAGAQRIEAGRWLSLRAAQSLNPAEVATALGYVQEISTPIVYDLHQFMGAMGLTLEHPLHRWTYRLRLLRSAFGGAGANLALISDRRWRCA